MTRPVWFMWHGGNSYSAPYVDDDVETAASAADVLAVCQDRYDNRDGTTPAVDDESGASVWYSDPRGQSDPYPDELVTRGRRGFRILGA